MSSVTKSERTYADRRPVCVMVVPSIEMSGFYHVSAESPTDRAVVRGAWPSDIIADLTTREESACHRTPPRSDPLLCDFVLEAHANDQRMIDAATPLMDAMRRAKLDAGALWTRFPKAVQKSERKVIAGA